MSKYTGIFLIRHDTTVFKSYKLLDYFLLFPFLLFLLVHKQWYSIK